MRSDTNRIKKPSLLYFFSEFPRSIWEFFQTLFFLFKYKVTKKSDGQPVLIVPGFLASDSSTRLLRKFLRRLGFVTYGWGLGRNYADLEDLEVLDQKLNKLYKKHNRRITLIGWSLGGVYARKLTTDNIEKVDQLITLGAPYMGIKQPNRAERTYKWLKRGEEISDVEAAWIEDLKKPIDTPTTAIYSKSDGIVSWRTCCEESEYEGHQNIEVRSSHFGMGWNKNVLKIIEDLLFSPHHHIHTLGDQPMSTATYLDK